MSVATMHASHRRSGPTIASVKSGMTCPTPPQVRCIGCAGSSVGRVRRRARTRSSVLRRSKREARRSRASRACWASYDYTTRVRIERRVEQALRKAKAHAYLGYSVMEPTAEQGWSLQWEVRPEVLADAACFDGVALLCTNVPVERLSAGEVMVKYKTQVHVEQTIDFIKSPVQIRPLWLHAPQRIAGLTLLIMIAVLVATLLEQEVRRWIAQTGEQLRGLMPEQRDTAHPTASALLRAFADYAWVVVRQADGVEEVVLATVHIRRCFSESSIGLCRPLIGVM